MIGRIFTPELWSTALEKYGEATGLSVTLFDTGVRPVLGPVHATPLADLFREFRFEPGLLADCARRCLRQTQARPAVTVDASHGLMVIGTSLVLEGEIVGAAVAGYALANFVSVPQVQRWSRLDRVPFDRLWNIVRRQPPVPERRLQLHGELLQVLGDALLRENHRTRQYHDAVLKLEAADASKDEFLAMLSHELRTPLVPILGWIDVLKNDRSPQKLTQALEVMERNVVLQSRMIDDLLDVTRIVQGKLNLELKALRLSACVRAALETMAPEIDRKAIRVELTDASEALFVEADAGRLQQIFRNILSNASKFTSAGGRISVTIKRTNDDALVVVADTGKGIAAEFLPHVFEMFRQQEQGTRREHQGLGIGLALVKRLAELQGGTVGITSAGAGHGTEVVVRLPLVSKPEVDEEVSAGNDQPASRVTGLSILIVEDSEDARESLAMLLEQLGAEVSVACDGREGLAMARELNPDVVLCDLRMPSMDGFEFLREFHRGPSQVYPPVVAVSGLASDADSTRMREAGFTAHVKKPYELADIVTAVGVALNQRQAR